MKRLKSSCILLFISIFILLGCTQKPDTKEDSIQAKETPMIQSFEFIENRFRRVSGWLSDRHILVHIQTPESEQLVAYDIYSAERRVIYDSPEDIVSLQLSDNSRYIALQRVRDNQSLVVIIDAEGQTVRQMTIETTSAISFQWNPEIEHQLFVSYPKASEESSHTVITSWDALTNASETLEGNTLNPTWYSMHTYLYIKPTSSEIMSEGALYYGDIHGKSDLLINSRVGHFYLNEDTFIAMATSDFDEDDIFLTKEYPLMVDQGYVTLPKVTLTDEVIYPFLTQGNRNGMIYAVVPKTRIVLEESEGEFELAVLDFETDTVKPIMNLPEYAPINISHDNKNLLYGWNYENVIDLRQKEIYSFLKDDD